MADITSPTFSTLHASTKANRAFSDYDFGDLYVEECDGWEHVSPGLEWTRKVYVREKLDDESTTALNFVVRFDSAGAVVEVYAMNSSGNYVGEPG